MGNIHCKGEQAKKSIMWIRWADNDYIAARQLILADLLVQGSGLSNTSIEKYFKALIMLLGLKNPRGHNICNLYNELKNKELKLKISEKYLELLFKSYSLRYPDDLLPGFNIVLEKAKLLCELDCTVYEIRKGFNFGTTYEKGTATIESLQEKKNPVLLNKNCYFGNYDRAQLFREISSCYELRVLEQGILEVFYFADHIEDNRKFDAEGLKVENRTA